MEWETLAGFAERAPGLDALRLHRLELVEARRRRQTGLPLGDALEHARRLAAADELVAPLILARARAAYDGRLVLIKGPEVAADYPAPGTRRYGDLDLLVDDAPRAQAALLAAGFVETGDPDIYAGIHHLRPLWLPGLSLTVELHHAVKWPAGLTAPPTEELFALAVPARAGVAGIEALPPAAHALVLAAHAWAHEPLGRLGHLLDYAATAARADEQELRVLAARWRCRRLHATTARAAAAVLAGRSSGAMRVWGRHLRGVRERTVLERHLQEWLSPWWLRGPAPAAAATVRAVVADLRRDRGERWERKLRRARMAVGNAGVAKSEHDRRLDGGPA
jgi:hypothetical protein